MSVFVGGGIGSVLRFLVSFFIVKFYNHSFPLATLISNILACFLMIFFILFFKNKTDYPEWFTLFLLTGVCGGFSTFSTFSYENYLLFQQNYFGILSANIIISVLVSLLFFIILLKN